jgi:hypothetical protein
MPKERFIELLNSRNNKPPAQAPSAMMERSIGRVA